MMKLGSTEPVKFSKTRLSLNSKPDQTVKQQSTLPVDAKNNRRVVTRSKRLKETFTVRQENEDLEITVAANKDGHTSDTDTLDNNSDLSTPDMDTNLPHIVDVRGNSDKASTDQRGGNKSCGVIARTQRDNRRKGDKSTTTRPRARVTNAVKTIARSTTAICKRKPKSKKQKKKKEERMTPEEFADSPNFRKRDEFGRFIPTPRSMIRKKAKATLVVKVEPKDKRKDATRCAGTSVVTAKSISTAQVKKEIGEPESPPSISKTPVALRRSDRVAAILTPKSELPSPTKANLTPKLELPSPAKSNRSASENDDVPKDASGVHFSAPRERKMTRRMQSFIQSERTLHSRLVPSTPRHACDEAVDAPPCHVQDVKSNLPEDIVLPPTTPIAVSASLPLETPKRRTRLVVSHQRIINQEPVKKKKSTPSPDGNSEYEADIGDIQILLTPPKIKGYSFGKEECSLSKSAKNSTSKPSGSRPNIVKKAQSAISHSSASSSRPSRKHKGIKSPPYIKREDVAQDKEGQGDVAADEESSNSSKRTRKMTSKMETFLSEKKYRSQLFNPPGSRKTPTIDRAISTPSQFSPVEKDLLKETSDDKARDLPKNTPKASSSKKKKKVTTPKKDSTAVVLHEQPSRERRPRVISERMQEYLDSLAHGGRTTKSQRSNQCMKDKKEESSVLAPDNNKKDVIASRKKKTTDRKRKMDADSETSSVILLSSPEQSPSPPPKKKSLLNKEQLARIYWLVTQCQPGKEDPQSFFCHVFSELHKNIMDMDKKMKVTYADIQRYAEKITLEFYPKWIPPSTRAEMNNNMELDMPSALGPILTPDIDISFAESFSDFPDFLEKFPEENVEHVVGEASGWKQHQHNDPMRNSPSWQQVEDVLMDDLADDDFQLIEAVQSGFILDPIDTPFTVKRCATVACSSPVDVDDPIWSAAIREPYYVKQQVKDLSFRETPSPDIFATFAMDEYCQMPFKDDFTINDSNTVRIAKARTEPSRLFWERTDVFADTGSDLWGVSFY